MFQHIKPAQVKDMMDAGTVSLVDVRDLNSYQAGHIKSAQPLDNSNVEKFVNQALQQENLNVVVCCYHGNSSQGAAQYLAEQGLKNVYSLDGGFEVFKISFPELVESHI